MLPNNEVNVEVFGDRTESRRAVLRDVSDQRPWQVLHVRSNFEKRVAEHLAVRAVEHYLPLYSERVKWTDRTVITERPLFSGYVFVRYSPHERITAISTPGVVCSLGDDAMNLVSSSELDKIREGLAGGLLLRPHPCISAGTRVRIRTGVFEGVEGLVMEIRQQCKVVIALAAVQQCFSLEVELGDIEVASKPVMKVASLPGGAGRSWSYRSARF
jgi:transcription antitermination factor NusG